MKIISKIAKNYFLAAAALCLGLIYLYFFCFSPPLISPDEFSYRFFARRLAADDTFFYQSPGDRIMGEKGFLPRKFHYNLEGEAVSRKPPGLILVWAAMAKLVGVGLAAIVFPLLALVVLFLFYLVTGRFFASRALRLAAVLLLAGMPVFLLRSHAYSPTMLNLAAFLGMLLSFDLLLDRGARRYYFLTGILAGLLIWIRPTSVLLWLPPLFCLVRERKKLRPVRLLWLVVPAAAVIVLYLIYNKMIFGNYFATGYSVYHMEPGARTAAAGIKGFFAIIQFHPRIWLVHLTAAPLAFTLAFPPLLIGLIGYYLLFKEGFSRRWLWLGGLTLVLLLLFFSNFETYGFYSRELNLRSSFLRYCLPGLVFLALPAAYFLSRLRKSFSAALALVLAFNILVALFAPLGLIETAFLGEYYRQARQFILDNTDSKTVVISSYWDKLVFPDRLVFSEVRDKDEIFLRSLISRINKRGYRAIYVEHKYDSVNFEPFRKPGSSDKVSGPRDLRGPLQWIKPPGSIYPVNIFELSLLKGEDTADYTD